MVFPENAFTAIGKVTISGPISTLNYIFVTDRPAVVNTLDFKD